MAVELSTPSFKPREYEGEKIEYLVYGLDDGGNEIECIDGPVDTPDSAAELAGDILKQFPGLYFHVTAVLYDANGKMKDSEVVWSNFPDNESAKSYVLAHKGPNDTTYCKNKAGDWTTHIEDAWEGSGPDSFSAEMKRNFADAVHCAVEDLEVVPVEKFESKGTNEKLSYEKGHKNSKGEDAPWVIRSHKDNSVLASFPTKKEAENHMRTMKRYSKTEGKFTEIKAAIKAAWSAAEAKWFRLDFREATERLDVYPIASDNEGVGVNWGVLPERNTIVQYATDLRTGDNQIEREMPYKDLDELEKIFVDEFKSMDETLEVGADNGADIHPLTENRPTESEVDKFLYNALDCASIDDGKNRIILKFTADAGAFDLVGYDGKTRKTLKSGELFSVVDRYRELVEMDQADAIREFEKE